MKYLITGGAGFIGSHLAENLIREGHSVTVIDNLSTGRFDNLESIANHPALRLIMASVMEKEVLEPAVRDADAVFHLASAVGVKLIMERPVETIESIFNSTDVVFRSAARYRRKILLTSTSEVYGKSNDVPFREDGDRIEGATTMHRWAYASAKALDEFLALAHYKTSGLPVVVLRLFNTVGPRQSAQYGMVLARFVEAALLGRPLLVYGDGAQSRCFCHVADVIAALTRAINSKECEGEVINVGNNVEVTIKELATKVVAATKSKSVISFVPYEKAFPGGGFEDMRRRVPSLEKAKRLLDWAPSRNLDTIITDTVMECRNRLNLE